MQQYPVRWNAIAALVALGGTVTVTQAEEAAPLPAADVVVVSATRIGHTLSLIHI